MANTITLSKADYTAINDFLEGHAENLAFRGDEGYLESENDEIRLENGMNLYLCVVYSTETYCTSKGDYFTPPSYDCDVYFKYEEAFATDKNDSKIPVGYRAVILPGGKIEIRKREHYRPQPLMEEIKTEIRTEAERWQDLYTDNMCENLLSFIDSLQTLPDK